MRAIQVAIIDEHPVMGEGLTALLSDVEDISVVHCSRNVEEVSKRLINQPANILLLVIYRPDPDDANRVTWLANRFPRSSILVLSMYKIENLVFRLIKAGAKGHLTSETNRDEIVEAIYTLRNGYDFYAKTITNMILSNYLNTSEEAEVRKEREKNLSTREMEVLKLFAQSLTNKEIADRLFISVRTVESHKSNIMRKINLKTTVDMVKFAIRNNLVDFY